MVARGTYHRAPNRKRAAMGRILVVEDDFEVRLVMENILLFAGYEVVAVATAASALAALDGERFDLVITDLRLADGDGMAVADTAAMLETKALLITGYTSLRPTERLRVKQFDCLLKPVLPTELIEAVQRTLEAPNANPA
jgi:DNA-binding NtrC family response regulator